MRVRGTWSIVAHDLFDRESPAQIDATGSDPLEGLIGLWQKMLREGVRDGGGATFTDFALEWEGGRTAVWRDPVRMPALAKLRSWIYGRPGPYQDLEPGQAPAAGLSDAAARAFLEKLALAHDRILPAYEAIPGECSRPLLQLIEKAGSLAQLEAWIETVRPI